MKKILIINALCLISFWANAQQKTIKKPFASPEAAFTQQFGESEIQVAYARPLARGRKIFGGLVPFDSLWRTGAAECTVLTFKEEVIIGGKKMAAGKYALFTIPTANDWTIILNSDVSLHGVFGYNATKDVHRFTAKSMKTDRFYESFTIEINDLMPNGDASLNLIWENTLVKIPLQSPHFVTTEAPVIAQTTVNTEGGNVVDLKPQFASVFSNYYELKDALIADNGKMAADKAKAMKTALAKLDTKTWSVKERTAYDAVAKKLETDAEHIGDNAGKIDHQREHFVTLSANLSSLAKSLKINAETTYLQFCPMANEGKGAYWLSKEEKVKNPYYGKKMLTCGSVKETLK